ncbi:hypothetical protein QZH41_011824 [Actinostola sp. cb2023]|nr:hypothetical protein QZH41_011824 [Actinostola sp. cb2023]
MGFDDVYEVSEFIGKGSFGEVNKCVHKATHEVFAVKEVAFTNEEDREKAVHEAKDLKPENLLLSEKSRDDRPPVIKLTDFGIAKQLQG